MVTKNQQKIFKVVTDKNKTSETASYKVTEIIAKHGRPFTDSVVVKECVLAIAEEVCPERKNIFENINVSTRICTRRTEDLGANFWEQFKDNRSILRTSLLR